MYGKFSISFFVFILLGAIFIQSTSAEQVGMASWYGGKFHGRKTANGEIFDTNKFTAAHRSLPFNTMVHVTNLDNGKSVTVRINDRGPFIQGRIIDLSQAAAEQLDMIHTGTARVSIEPVSVTASKKETTLPAPRVSKKPSADTGRQLYLIQVGSFSVPANAERLHALLSGKGFRPDFESAPPDITRVVLRNITHTELDHTVAELRRSGFNEILIRKAQ